MGINQSTTSSGSSARILRTSYPGSQPYSWAKNLSEAKELFELIFKSVDGTVASVRTLDEYYQIFSWMQNTEGKGLLLMGSCGRGKSVIASGIIPCSSG